MSRGWILVLTPPCEWLTANDRRDRRALAGLVRQWRTASYMAATKAKLPKGLERVSIHVVARFAEGKRPPVRDAENLAPTIKAVVDGLGPARVTRTVASVGYGLVVDDSTAHVQGPYLSIGDPVPARVYGIGGELVIKIRELEAGSG